MPDEMDYSLTQQEADLERCIEAARGQLPPLMSGICDDCGCWDETLRGGVCTPCRSAAETKSSFFRR